MLDASPEQAAVLVRDLAVLVVFVAVVGLAMSIVLSLHVARSVAGPLGAVERAMDAVAAGDLEQRAPVVSTDEIGALAEGFNRMTEGLRERERIVETFGRYVSREIRDEILAGRVALGGQTLDVTILFSDLRDFTPWVEATPARDVVAALNSYFSEMEAAIREHHGLVLQFIGDEIEAVFGAPLATADHPTMAVRAALDMRRRLAAWNARRRAAGLPEFHHGIGIHSGTVLAGNIGSPERLAYSLVGDPVNLASRIQGLNKDFGSDVLVSGTTRKRLAPDADVDLVALPATRVKGKSAEVEVWRLR
jgi:adenylate cyclase